MTTNPDAPTETGASYVPESCAVGVIDALGFKGIWKRYDPQKVIETLLQGRATAASNDELTGDVLTGGHIHIRTRFFSDTIVITAVPSSPDQTHSSPAELVTQVGFQAAAMCVGAACGHPPLAYRGCISYGRLAVTDEFFVGEAIDEAAEWHEQADAALVWLTPSAAEVLNTEVEDRDGTSFLTWEVPLKQGRRLRTLVVNPLQWAGADDGRESILEQTITQLRENLLLPFAANRSVDVGIKRKHTEEFLSAAHGQAHRWWERQPKPEPFDFAAMAQQLAKGPI